MTAASTERNKNQSSSKIMFKIVRTLWIFPKLIALYPLFIGQKGSISLWHPKEYVTGRRRHGRPCKLYIFLISYNSRVDIALYVDLKDYICYINRILSEILMLDSSLSVNTKKTNPQMIPSNLVAIG